MQRRKANPELSSTEALADALRPIASVMIQGGLSASALVLAAKLAYVRAAVIHLKPRQARANISRLSVITGMTRKEIAFLMREQGESSDTSHPRKSMEHRALRVLRGWTSDPLYQTASGRPTDLPINGEGRTFASLVRAYAGDVTTMAVLRELERLKAVARSRTGDLRARPGNGQARMRTTARFRDFSRLLADFSDTTAQLIAERDSPVYFGFKELEVTTSSQAENFKHSFGKRAALLLDGVENWGMRQAGKRRNSGTAQKQSPQRIGLGVYLVQRSASDGVVSVRKR